MAFEDHAAVEAEPVQLSVLTATQKSAVAFFLVCLRHMSADQRVAALAEVRKVFCPRCGDLGGPTCLCSDEE